MLHRSISMAQRSAHRSTPFQPIPVSTIPTTTVPSVDLPRSMPASLSFPFSRKRRPAPKAPAHHQLPLAVGERVPRVSEEFTGPLRPGPSDDHPRTLHISIPPPRRPQPDGRGPTLEPAVREHPV